MYNNLNRMAYIIGISNYQNLSPLEGPINDANMIEKSLRKCGFCTNKYTDLTYSDFREKVSEFKYRCIEYDVGLFYFAGHGFEYQGENYLCPIDSKINNLKETNINISGIVNEISKDRTFVGIVILDCCRDIYVEKNRGHDFVGDMIPNFKNNGGTYIAYATSSGDSAVEKGGYGIYTQSLCRYLTEENKQIEQIFKNVRKDIIGITTLHNSKIQIPWEYSSLVSDFYFIKKVQYDNVNVLAQNAIDNGYQFEQIKKFVSKYCEDNNIEEQSSTLYEVLSKIDKLMGE